jgi:paraquat-inducible protein A
MWGIAIVVFLASMLFPILSILLSLVISAHLYFNRFNRYLILSLRVLHHIEEWAMLEVYLMGIIVACVKLSSMSELKFGLGLSAFVLLLIVSITLSSNFDSALFWQKMDQLRSKKRISQQAHD